MGGGATGKGDIADANLNVVPFIDLLACTICFLLASAAWMSMSRIDVDQALPRGTPKQVAVSPPVHPTLRVAVTQGGYWVQLANASLLTPPRPDLEALVQIPSLGIVTVCRGNGPDCKGDTFRRQDRRKLGEILAQLVHVAGVGKDTHVMVAAGDDVPYLHLIGALDVILGACEPGPRCLASPTIADLGMLRHLGMAIPE